MKFKHKVIVLSSIGFGMGVIIGTVLTAILATKSAGDGNFYFCSKDFLDAIGNPVLAFSLQSAGCAIQGALSLGGAAVYEIEEWGITKCTIIHYLMVMIACYVLGFSVKWFSKYDFCNLLVVFLLMTAAYFFVWLIFYISYRIQLKKINEELNELKMSESKGENSSL